MPLSLVTVSAPGSLMLFGEHAVLHGRLALVAAISQRLTVSLRPRADDEVRITSALGTYTGTRRDPPPSDTFRFIVAALRLLGNRLPSGFDLAVESEFSSTIGFGSSAAVTAATVAAFLRWSQGGAPAAEVFAVARDLIHTVQGAGSGADVAASVYGGIVRYRAAPLEVEPLPHRHPLTAVYSGSKLPTPAVIARVEAARRAQPDLFARIFDAMDDCAARAAAAAARADWPAFGALLNIAHGLMDAIGVNNTALARIVHDLRADSGILGAKISGSGLGDCAVGLGRTGADFTHAAIPVEIAPRGLVIEAA